MARQFGSGSQMSEAFVEKTAKEKARLVHKLAGQLKSDMARLLEDTENADIILVAGGEHLLSHKIMLQTRVPEFFAFFIGKNSTAKKIMIQNVVAEDLKSFLRDIYSMNEISTWRDTIKEWIKRQDRPKHSVEAGMEEMEINGKAEQSLASYQDDDIAMVAIEDHNGNEHGACGVTMAMEISSGLAQCNYHGYGDDRVKSMELESQGSEDAVFVNGKSKESVGNVIQDTFLKANMPEATCFLARDLLHMFVHQESTDITLIVQDKRIKAHRFILCCRSVYFTAMLCGGWAESSAEEITLFDVSCSTALAALYYIYGGVMEDPTDTSIGELVQMSDMYGLDGLKDNAAFILRRDKCHFFHKPCSACLSGVPECLALSTAYGLHAVAENCLRWITKHLDKVWSTKTFAVQAQEVLQHSYEFATSTLGEDNVVAVAMQCDKLLTGLPHVKWVESVRHLATSLHCYCIDYIIENFYTITNHRSFTILLADMAWSSNLVEAIFLTAIESLNVENGCKMFAVTNALRQRSEFEEWSQDVIGLLDDTHSSMMTFMTNNVNHLMRSKDWQIVPEDLREKIKRDAVFVDDTKRMLAPKPTLSSSFGGTQGQSGSSLRSSIPKRPSRLPTSLRKTTPATDGQFARPKTAIPVVNRTKPLLATRPQTAMSTAEKQSKEKSNVVQRRPVTVGRSDSRSERGGTPQLSRKAPVQMPRPTTLLTKTMTVATKQDDKTKAQKQPTRRPASASPTVLRVAKPPVTTIISPSSPTSPTDTRPGRHPTRVFTRSKSDGTKERPLSGSQNTNVGTDRKENSMSTTNQDPAVRPKSSFRSSGRYTRSSTTPVTSPQKDFTERIKSPNPVRRNVSNPVRTEYRTYVRSNTTPVTSPQKEFSDKIKSPAPVRRNVSMSSAVRSDYRYARSNTTPLTSPQKEIKSPPVMRRNLSSPVNANCPSPVQEQSSHSHVVQSSPGTRSSIPTSPRMYRSPRTQSRHSPEKVQLQDQPMDVDDQRHSQGSLGYSSSGYCSSPRRGRISPVKGEVLSPRRPDTSDADSGQSSREGSFYSSTSEYSSREPSVRYASSPDPVYESRGMSSPQSPRHFRVPSSPGRHSQSPVDADLQMRPRNTSKYSTDDENKSASPWRRQKENTVQNCTTWTAKYEAANRCDVTSEAQDVTMNACSSLSPESSPGSPGRRLGSRARPRSGIPRPIKSPSPTQGLHSVSTPPETLIPVRTFLSSRDSSERRSLKQGTRESHGAV
ncbi:uncharacterized protein LOC144440913 isoform X2 [Glandiceps talaboti]